KRNSGCACNEACANAYYLCLTFEQLGKEFNDYKDNYNQLRCQWDLKQMTPCEYRKYLFQQPRSSVVLGTKKLPSWNIPRR
ncbi:MAG: IS3 family transposase, partial [Candidatus Enterosoma sp.]